MKKRSKKRKFNNVIYFWLIIFLLIFIFSGVKIFIWFQDNRNSNKVLDSISDDIEILKDTNEYKIDFLELKKKNSDVVAFVKVNGTNIEYPVVKYIDNDYYLNHSFDKSINGAGWPFANYINKFDGTDKNISIFAHARRDGSMFGSLFKVLSREWRNEDNYKIIFITEKETSYYQVFSTYKIFKEEYYIKNNFDSESEYIEFLDKIKSRSNYNYNVDLRSSDSIITLSTCSSDDDYRIVLHAKKIVS